MSAVAIYHVVHETEDFSDAATKIHELLTTAIAKYPTDPRHLYLDIEGHRNEAGGFDDDMFELITHFLVEHLGAYFTEISTPLYDANNKKEQINTEPEPLVIQDAPATKCHCGRDIYRVNSMRAWSHTNADGIPIVSCRAASYVAGTGYDETIPSTLVAMPTSVKP